MPVNKGADVRQVLIYMLAATAAGLGSAAIAKEPPPFVPVFATDFADAFVLPTAAGLFGYATNAQGFKANVPMARATNLTDWTLIRDGKKLHDAMPVMPPWARPGFTWAPEVIATSAGYALHFTAKDKRTGLQCIGAAFSTSPLGPFTSTATEPLVCQTALGGTIDSSPFRDADGTLYLYYKNDGNNPAFRKATDIYVQRLSDDGLSVVGDAKPLLRNDTKWEAHVIEAPTMALHDGKYTMFFSANHFGWEPDQPISVYAIGYATCDGPTGPCTDATENPILHSYNSPSAGCLSGPGHQTVFAIGQRQFLAFHAWSATTACERANKGRFLYIAPLRWEAGKPVLQRSLRP